MTAPEHLKITGPEDILGFIPHSLGYWPARSLVAMTLQGKRLGATLRVDLPDEGAGGQGGPPAAVRFARSVASYLEADEEADGSLLAFFTGMDGDGSTFALLLQGLEHALAEAGMPVRDAWLIGADYWRNAYCNDPSCCAMPGRPVDEIRNSRLNAEMVFRGSTVGSAPGDPVPAPTRHVDPVVLAAEDDWALLFAGRRRERPQFAGALEVWTRVLRAPPGQELPAGLAGYLRATLCVPAWRDAVLVMAAAGPEAAGRGAEDFGVFDDGSGQRQGRPDPLPPLPLPPLEGFPPPARPGDVGGADGGAAGGSSTGNEPVEVPAYGKVLLGLAPPVPDWPLMGQLDRILVQLAEAGGEAGAAALTGRGWIEWCRGKGSYADALFILAEAEYPGYRLAELLAELVRRGTLCGWAGRKDSAWQKFEADAA
ncbi:DUF4192 family protein [Arthrobacter sp. CG_A4]|uniref:DUF4192 family protein n=1 Tax=Arthrobacter sp. CG_A4 TaxID=3071706 RepID=UPI002E064B02|nr:hypothetical protein [Arthrobacter sp. CG_A4]